MMKTYIKTNLNFFLFFICFFITGAVHAQQNTVTIGGQELKADAVLYLIANGNQGLILPAVDNIATFNPTTEGTIVYNRSDKRVHFWTGTQWVPTGGGGSTGGGDAYTLRLQGANLELVINGTVQDQVALSSFAVGGDLSGNIQNASVVSLNGVALPGGVPATNQILVSNGSIWEYQNLPSGTFTGVSVDNNGTITGDGNTTPLSVGTITNAQISDVAFTKITGVPADLADGDDVGILAVNTNASLTGDGNATALGVNTGTGANQIVQLDGAGRLPAVDGSQLTGLTGGGDMLSATYDPGGINGDAFDRANHTGTQLSGTISDFNTAADTRADARIAAASVTALTDVTNAGSGLIITDVERTNLNNQSGTNTGDEPTFAGAGTSGVVPDPGAETGRVLSDDGTWITPAGSGDMLSATYDPGGINGDAFDRTNHTGTQLSGTISDFNTAADTRADARIAAASVTALTDVTNAGSGLIITDVERTNLNNQSGTNTGDEPTFAGAGTSGVVPDPGAETGRVLSDDGTWITPAGSGDMLSATYDPGGINGDAFDRANHTGTQLSGTISDFNTAADTRADARIAAASVTTLTDVTNAGSGLIITDVERTNLNNQSGTNTGDQTAVEVAVTPTTDLTSIDVQGALEELQTEILAIPALPTTTDGQIIVSNGITPTAATMSGDVIIGNTGITTIADGAISGGTGGKITDGTITNADIAAGAAIDVTKISGLTDNDATNELNTTFQINAGNLEITDAGGTLSVPLTSIDTDDQTAVEVAVTPTTDLTSTDVQGALEELQTEILAIPALPTTTDGQIIVSNGTTPTATTMSGDVTIGSTGITTIVDGTISGGIGGKIADGTIATADMADAAITTSKMAPNGTTRSILANSNAGTVQWVSPTGDNQVLGSNGTGDLVFRNATTAAVNGGTGISVAASASDGIIATELSVREAIDAIAAPSLQNAYDAGPDGNITLATNEFSITSSTANPLFTTDNTNNRIGIGTTTPTNKLHVAGGSVDLDLGQFYEIGNENVLGFDGTTVQAGSNLAVPLALWAGAELARLETNGNFGLGTTTPLTDIQIGTNSHLFNLSSGTGGTGLTYNMYESAGSLLHTTTGTAATLALLDGQAGIFINSSAAADAAFGTSLANRLIVTETGVSINKDGPHNSAVLHLVSSTVAGGGTPRGFLMPSMITSDRDAIPTPLPDGLMIYNQDNQVFNYYDGTAWTALGGGGGGSLQDAYLNGNTIDINTTDGDFLIRNNAGTNNYFNVSAVNGNIGIGKVSPGYKIDITSTDNSLLNIESSKADLNTEAGIRLAMSSGSIGTVYKVFAQKSNGAIGGTQSNFVIKKEFSTAGGEIEFLKYENATNNLILNATNTTAGSYGNVIINGGNVGIGSSIPTVSLDINTTDAIKMPIGTTAQRPTAAPGMLRYNSDNNSFEGYSGGAWSNLGGGGSLQTAYNGGSTIQLDGANNFEIWNSSNVQSNFTVANTGISTPVSLTVGEDLFVSQDVITSGVTVNSSISFKDGDATANFVHLSGPSTAASNYQLRLPGVQGALNQVMVNDGSGVLSWADQLGDNLGNHTATQVLDMATFGISFSGAGAGTGLTTTGSILDVFSNANIRLSPAVGSDVLIRNGTTEYARFDGSTQRLGIGTATPSAALDVVGDVETSGEYTYSVAKTRYYSVPVASFSRHDETVAYNMVKNFTSGAPNYMYFTGGTAGSAAYATAAVNLPHGAVITNFRAIAFNSSATTRNVELYRVTAGSSSMIAQNLFPTGGSIQTMDDNTISSAIVDNSQYSYAIRIVGDQNGGTNVRFYHIIITYTVTQAD